MKVSKLFRFLLGLSILVPLLASCTGKPDAGNAASTLTPAGTLPIVKEKTTMSIFLGSRLANALYTNDTLTLRTLQDRTGIEFDITTLFQRQAVDKLKLIMATNEIPDLVAGGIEDLNRYGVMGAFRPITEEDLSQAPNLKRYLFENKEVRALATATDGKMYAVPMQSAIRTAMGYNIRQDWLDKLGLERPETIDEWYEVLKAFRDRDPNGNGKKDEVPLVLDRAWENYYLNFADAWGIELNPNNQYWAISEGKVVFAPMTSAAKDFLVVMARWYKEGLIDKEFVTREDTNNYHMLNDRVGATAYWTGYVAAQNKNAEIQAKAPGVNWQVIPPPVLRKGEKGRTYSQQLAITGHGWAISNSNPNPVAALRLMDYVYSEEGSILFNFGVEGLSFERKGEELVYKDSVVNSEKGLMIWMRENGLQPLIGFRQMPEYEAQFAGDPDVRRQLFDYVENDRFYPATPTLVLSDRENAGYKPLMDPIMTYTDEMILKFMIGAIDIEKEWPEFTKKLESMNIADCTNIKQAAYDRFLKARQ